MRLPHSRSDLPQAEIAREFNNPGKSPVVNLPLQALPEWALPNHTQANCDFVVHPFERLEKHRYSLERNESPHKDHLQWSFARWRWIPIRGLKQAQIHSVFKKRPHAGAAASWKA